MSLDQPLRSHPAPARPGPPAIARSDRARSIAVLPVAVGVGIGVGVLTSFAQGWLGGPFAALANSASAWLVAPFLVGALARGPRRAAAVGLACCLAQLVGYDLCATLRGFAVSISLDAFWGVAAVIGGPLFGLAGAAWRSPRPGLRGIGPAALAAAFVAEGVWTYLLRLHETGTAALWLAIGAAIAVAGLRGVREWRWLALTLPAGLLAMIALGAIRI